MNQSADRLRVMRVISRMNVGGPAVQAVALLRGLDPQRYEQRLYTGYVGPDEQDHLTLRAPDLDVRRVPGLGRAVRPGDDLRAFAHLVAQMRAFRPHIVHTHAAKAGALGRLAAAATGVPVRIHTYHGHLLHGYFRPAVTRAVVAAERMLARRTDRIVAVGEQVRDDLLAAGIGHGSRYTVIPAGTDLSPPPSREAARGLLEVPLHVPVVAFVGRVTGIKRPDRMLAVVRRLRETLPDLHVLVCGDGDQMPLLRAAQAELGPGLQLLGWRPDVETVYAAADLALLTSDNEGTPVCLIEAAQAGLPSVATRVGSVAQVVLDGRTGLLCDPADEAALTSAALTLLRDPELRRDLGERARQHSLAQLSSARLVSDVDSLYSAYSTQRELISA